MNAHNYLRNWVIVKVAVFFGISICLGIYAGIGYQWLFMVTWWVTAKAIAYEDRLRMAVTLTAMGVTRKQAFDAIEQLKKTGKEQEHGQE